jgi:hypothetical protein
MACGPVIGPKIPREAATASSSSPPTPEPSTKGSKSLGPAPDDLRKVDWATTTLPADFCSIPEPVSFRNGEAQGISTKWGQVRVSVGEFDGGKTYGDIDGDGRAEAVIGLGCDNNGGTASGQLAFGYAVLRSTHSELQALGTIDTRMNPDSGHVTLLGGVTVSPGTIVVKELWYRSSDSTCCPTGTARTTWSWRDGTLTAGPVVVTS